MNAGNAAGRAKNPLGTEKIGRLIVKFAVPAIISLLVNALYNIVDQIFIGQGIGVLGNAATNVAFPLTTICTAAGLLLGVGSASNFNLRLGEKRKEDAVRCVGNGVTLSVLSGAILSAVSFLALEPMLLAFGATDPVMPYAREYTAIICLGIPFLIFSTVVANLIRADGSPRYSMAVLLSGAIFNLIFDPVFMIGLDMGIAGIAWATTLGQMLSCGVAVSYLTRFKAAPLKKETFRLRGKDVRAILALGSASCFNQLAMMAVQITMNNTLTYYGARSAYGSEIPLAAVGVITKINVLFLSCVIGVAQGCQPINGYNYGAGQYGRVRKTYKSAALIVLIIGAAAFACFQIFPRQIALVFGTGSEEYFTFAEHYFRVFMLLTFVNGLQSITSNFFTSIGKARKGIFISLTRQIIFLLPLILILPAAMGIEGVLYAGPFADGASVLLCFLFAFREMRELRRKSEGTPISL